MRVPHAPRALDAVTGVSMRAPPPAEATAYGGGGGSPRAAHAALRHGVESLGEKVLHAAERAAEALRISSEEGTRGTP